MPPATEILDNIVAIAEIMASRNASAPDVPYLELAKWVRVTKPAPPSRGTIEGFGRREATK